MEGRPMLRYHLLVVFLFAFFTTAGHAKDVTCKVVGITDGDAITVLVAKKQYKIRLDGIDCPEKGQPFSTEARKHIVKLCFNKTVTIRPTRKDEKKRQFGYVLIGETNVNRELLKEGLAWHDKQADKDDALAKLETEARKAERGLWADADPIPPWEWRKMSTAQRAKRLAAAKTPEQPVVAVEPQPPPRPKPPPLVAPGGLPALPVGSLYWLDLRRGIRHVRGCQFHTTTKPGRACGPNEGRPCTICGGR